MTVISDLPRDLVVDILSRVPLKLMREVRLTCKLWNTLSTNQSFSKMQIDKEKASTKEGESQMIVWMNKSLYLVSVFINRDPLIELKGKITCLTEKLKVSQVFNCEGLLLCILQEEVKDTKFVVWNPYCLQPKWFEPTCSYRRGSCFYGFGYVEKKKNKSCRRSHKILRFINNDFYEIYDIESESWKTLDITSLRSIKFYDYGITVKGNTYWPVIKGNANGIEIISFDFTKERFGPLMHLPYNNDIHDNVLLSCVREKKLAALLYRMDIPNSDAFDIWITTEIEAEKLTWSKFLTVDLGPERPCDLDSFIIDEEKKLVIGYDDNIIIIGKSGYFRELDFSEKFDNDDQWQHLCAYAPSLVQIKQTEGDKMNNSQKALM